jgi:hypothetical protein
MMGASFSLAPLLDPTVEQKGVVEREELKDGRRFSSHEEMIEAKGFHEIEKKIMHMMRDEMRNDRKEALQEC